MDIIDEKQVLEKYKKDKKEGAVTISLQEFIQKIETYDINAFLDSDDPNGPPPERDPYDDLVNASGYQAGLFDQYAAAMLNVVKKKCTEKGINKATEDYIEQTLKFYIQFKKYSEVIFIDNTNDIMKYIKKVASDPAKKDQVSILPLICGSGKSTTLTKLVLETIIRIEYAQNSCRQTKEGNEKFKKNYIPDVSEQDFDGLLIVTDSKKRLGQIWDPSPGNKYIGDIEREYIKQHQNKWVSVLTEDNYAEEEERQYYKPILCLTTQRYFAWTKEEIVDHLNWKDENGKHRRPLIIFDEQPYLNEVRDISIKTINDIDTALRVSLDNEVDTEKKKWCQDQWNNYRSWFIGLSNHYEYDFNGIDTLFFKPEKHSITEDDDQFFGFIETHRKKIRSKDHETYNNLYIVRHFMNSWSIFSHRNIDTGEYSNKFTVYIDNSDKVTNLGVKVIILDGTGDVSPIYSGQDYIDLREGTNFLRSLTYLTIKLCDLSTSKEDFRKKRNKHSQSRVSISKATRIRERKDGILYLQRERKSISGAN